MIETTITHDGVMYTVGNDTLKVGDTVLAKYSDGSIRIFKLHNKHSDLNDFVTTIVKDIVYWKVDGSIKIG